jgi:homoserine O-acetyltransferase/O-succinyltransferase
MTPIPALGLPCGALPLRQRMVSVQRVLGGVTAALLIGHAATGYAHWPGQPAHQMAYLGDLELEDGGVIKNFRMSYVTHGKLNAAKDNAILFMHGWAANHHNLDHLIGPGQAFDTDKYFIICSDELGNPQTTFEHTTSPTNSGLKMKFPQYKGRDRVKAEYKLVTEALKIPHLLAVTGISSGADHAVQMAVSYPDFMEAVLPISGGALGTTQFFSISAITLSILENCAGWEGGNYQQNPKVCAYNAMAVGIPLMYTPDWWDKYIDSPEAYTKWRNTTGEYYYDIQDARDLYYRQTADLRGWVGDTPGFNGDLTAVLVSIKARTLFLANPDDHWVPKQYYELQANTIPGAQLVWIDSVAGHLICCNADPNATRALNLAITKFLSDLATQRRMNR